METNHLRPVEVPLSQGLSALIDPADADRVLAHRWHAVIQSPHLRYAARCIADGKIRRRLYLHRFLLDAGPGRDLVVDHINHNGLDNQRANLRLVTQSENIKNSRFRRPPGAHVGVHRSGDNWLAKIVFERRYVNLGTFKTYAEACAAYEGAYIAFFGKPYMLSGGSL